MINNFDTGKIWWPNGNYFKNNYHLAEWYNGENSEIITYFDSWNDLKHKIESTDFDALRKKIKKYAKQHRTKNLNEWKTIFNKVTKSTC